ncbi:MAG: arsenite methyltransferase [Alphaproteobacteria bacterium]
MKDVNADEIRGAVREAYAKVATADTGGDPAAVPETDGGGGTQGACCSPGGPADSALDMGYDAADLDGIPDGANMGLGCGNPVAIASLAPGETVLDLGSGGGFDCFLAARQVGATGHVIGVDMTPEMVAKARANVVKMDAENVEFRLGEIEHLPVADASVDVIISNCVINLSPDKAAVFSDAFRILRPGGRLMISDVVATAPIPEAFAKDPALIAGCMGNAALIDDLRAWLAAAGFIDVEIDVKEESRRMIAEWAPGSGVEGYTASATIQALRPSA